MKSGLGCPCFNPEFGVSKTALVIAKSPLYRFIAGKFACFVTGHCMIRKCTTYSSLILYFLFCYHSWWIKYCKKKEMWNHSNDICLTISRLTGKQTILRVLCLQRVSVYLPSSLRVPGFKLLENPRPLLNSTLSLCFEIVNAGCYRFVEL